jgi:DNA primase
MNNMDAVEDIKSRLSIEDVIGEYLELKRAGRNLRALSPFSNEKTPSFMVSPEKQIWHDFSSGKGGNMFSFVMEMEGVDFKGALEILARKAGIDLSQYQTGASAARGKQKQRLYELLELAAKFYQVQFSHHKTALEYILKKRGFTKQTVLDFQIGYAPNTGHAVIDFLNKKGFSEAEIKKAGLAASRYQRPADMFRGRIMVPLHDANGRVVGFTARLLKDEPSAPKYINTPQTLLYDKGRQVYGLHLAKEAIRKSKFVVVVEGNLDVIASHQAGVKNVVATAGTAMTPMHLKELGRFTPDVRLAFDQDQAGLNAAERAIPLAHQAGVSLSMITIPSGKDPDELIQKDPTVWQEVITKHQYALDWLITQLEKQYDLTSATGKRQFSDKILPVVQQISDSVEQDHYVEVLAQKLSVSKVAIEQKLSAKTVPTRQAPKKKTSVQKVDKITADVLKTQNQLMALLLLQPKLRATDMPLTEDMVNEEQARELLKFLKANPTYNFKDSQVKHADGAQDDGENRSKSYQEYGARESEPATQRSAANSSSVPSSARKQATVLLKLRDYVKMLVLLYEEIYQDLEFIELEYEATRLQVRLIERYVKTQKQSLAKQLANANDANTQKLLEKAKEFDNLLKLA